MLHVCFVRNSLVLHINKYGIVYKTTAYKYVYVCVYVKILTHKGIVKLQQPLNATTKTTTKL